MRLSSRQFILGQILFLAGCQSHLLAASPPTVKINGLSYVSLAYINQLYTMTSSTSTTKISLKNRYNTIAFAPNSTICTINGVGIRMHNRCIKQGRNWLIQKLDFTKVIDPTLRSYAHLSPKTPSIVVLDPGHGGKDSGALGKRGVQEKLVAQEISLRVKQNLEAKGIQVKMTRSTDKYLTLQQRCNIARAAKADLFISIHADGAENPQANGVETFVLTAEGCESTNKGKGKGDLSRGAGNAFDGDNAVLGYSIQANLLKQTKRRDRGVRRARFFVIKNTPCPAALVECGFVTNKEEEALMCTANYRESVARGIANGIIGYITQAKRATLRK